MDRTLADNADTEKKLTLGSLFSGSGGFELGGLLSGIQPVWASEIEPFPIRVTTKRLPFVKHLGDICGLHGDEIEPVDIITFGSPCTDMSVAGKRAGLGGKQSSLFYEAVRIIKEMRCATDGKYPRFIVWENVPGAFSSNKGEDFRCVLEEICSVGEEGIHVPGPAGGKWAKAGEVVADGFSLAWRQVDACLWGTPQRRKRIYLVGDLNARGAGKILFESEGVSGYSAEGFRAWQRASRHTEKGAGASGGIRGGMTFRACPPHGPESAGFCTEHSAQAQGIGYGEEQSPTLRAGTVPAAMVFENHSQAARYTGPLETAPTVSATYGMGGNNQTFVAEPDTPETMRERAGKAGGGRGILIQEDKSAALSCNNGRTVSVPVQAFGICSKESNAMKSGNPRSGFYEAGVSRTLDCSCCSPSANQGGIAVVEPDGMQAFALQGSMIGRKDKNGPQGSGVNEGVSFTLDAVDRHAVAYPTYCTSKNSHFTRAEKELANTLVATDYKDPPVINDVQTASGKGVFGTLSASMGSKQWPGNQEAFSGDCHIIEPDYIVRRLTPTECARLQGFPGWWCSGLGTENPTEKEMAFWREVFETRRRIMGTSKKPKTDKQIIKWLKDPHSDSAEYKMWGNAVYAGNVYFVLSGIVYYSQFPDFLL